MDLTSTHLKGEMETLADNLQRQIVQLTEEASKLRRDAAVREGKRSQLVEALAELEVKIPEVAARRGRRP